MRRILYKILKNEKIGMKSDVQEDNLIWAALRYLYMSYFRHFRDEVLDEDLIRQISTDGRNPIARLLLDLVHKDVEVESSGKIKLLLR